MVGVDETSEREAAAAAGVARTSNCFSKMMMAAGAESPSVATQSAKTDILQKIGQRGNNHQETEAALGKIRNKIFAKTFVILK